MAPEATVLLCGSAFPLRLPTADAHTSEENVVILSASDGFVFADGVRFAAAPRRFNKDARRICVNASP